MSAARVVPFCGASSPTAIIFSAAEFAADCDRHAEGCAYFHTLGMEPGELVYFRNGDVIHGTAAVGDPKATRVALAIDCEVPNPSRTHKWSNFRTLLNGIDTKNIEERP